LWVKGNGKDTKKKDHAKKKKQGQAAGEKGSSKTGATPSNQERTIQKEKEKKNKKAFMWENYWHGKR